MQVWVVHAMLGKKRTKLVEARKGYSRKDGMWGTDDLGVLPCLALLCFALLSFLPFFLLLLFSTPALPADRLIRKN